LGEDFGGFEAVWLIRGVGAPRLVVIDAFHFGLGVVCRSNPCLEYFGSKFVVSLLCAVDIEENLDSVLSGSTMIAGKSVTFCLCVLIHLLAAFWLMIL
jgi:hypothetical protein